MEKSTWEYVKKIYPVYGAKNLSALINGLLHFFTFCENPPEVDVRRLLQDALAGKVYSDNPAVLKADQVRTDFLEFISETYESTMLQQLCQDWDFLRSNTMMQLNIQRGFSEAYEYVLTDAELFDLFAVWRDQMEQSGKYRAAYREYNDDRLARERAKQYD